MTPLISWPWMLSRHRSRYVMSYGSKGGGGLKGEEAERITESKYERIYEDGLDPFKEFDSREFKDLDLRSAAPNFYQRE